MDIRSGGASVGTKTFTSGSLIYREGDSSQGEMYIINKGSAIAFKNYGSPEQEKTSLTVGDFFGEQALFLGKKRNRTVFALTDLEVREITGGNVHDFFRQEPETAVNMFGTLCHKLVELEARAPRPKLKAAPAPKTEGDTRLFPEGHGQYELPLSEQKPEYMYEKTYTCPVCGNTFKMAAVKPSKLVALQTDPDLRVHYRNVEPLYYDVVVCSACLYSALGESFTDLGDGIPSEIKKALEKYKGVTLNMGEDYDAATVFAAYYLAVQCARLTSARPQLALGKLWLKLSRIYDDAGDDAMNKLAAENALDAYLTSYQNSYIPEKQVQQLCYIIGELYNKFGKQTEALKFLFMAKTNKQGSPVVRRKAEDRIDQIKGRA